MYQEVIHQKAEKPNGKSLLFIHGMWHGAWCWAENFLPYFADLGYDTYALSLRNHGSSQSDKPMWRIRMKDYVEDIEKAIDSIKGNPILIGHSMGGFVIQKYMEKYKPPGVILLGSVPPNGIWDSTFKVIKKYPFTYFKATFGVNLKHIISNKKKAKQLMFSTDFSDEKMDRYHPQLCSEAYLGYVEMLGFSLPKLSKIDPPKMLVIGGGNDVVVSQKKVQKTADTYGAAMSMIPAIAHDMMLDTNWTAVAERMGEWLEEI